MTAVTAQDILHFWFTETDSTLWFKKDEAFDALIRQRFQAVHTAANAAELYDWRSSAEGRLAEIIVLDQFSRNIYREDARAFASDALALVLAQEAVAAGAMDALASAAQQAFLIMPYMHSESLPIHEIAVNLFSRPGLENNLDFEYRHKAIIERFGRYPHRNALLGRQSSAEEAAFLKEPGSSF